ncbi:MULTISPECIES: BON domain-containing protein [unclassified Undibacterium]|uniref:BON domain-containing protein n=1 Tax=unclassified Undibacterium TaxID=2630295 RepID=UPI002AC9E950|nr:MULTISPECIES: BON domain-containing protein [unclassified Undibacterium]MEB0139944.1 BON domain-containing protein [Undibacterium sp. CCC2.1]MEB0172917.1 BON domain-containing protein [Undibacterium sp. CCC1.1]MEB0176744.1 BON domain-containing protein [Undibacterium sp. CCC3.4]MEB0216671.1 BON domain-containing protein [Undibacterium sp. 5I2]WPX44983.1 BON domain-containing protein [Undibacterium sp. CCC3.4]
MNKLLVSRRRLPLAAAALCCVAVLSLQGCVEFIVGSAVVSTFAATDRRTLGAQTEDKAIAIKGENRVSKALGDAAHVNVNSFNRRVLLTGEVADEAAKQTAARELSAVEGVLSVSNEIAIAGLSNFTARSNDALLTTKVKASFVDTQGLFASAFKVVTESGTVYLMGRVTPHEGDLAADVASRISGVRKVVKVLEYLSDAELKAMLVQPQPAPENKSDTRN